MAIQIPEYLQTKTYSAKKDRRVQQAEVMQEGIVDFGHYKVTQRGAGANMSVDVAAGEAWVDGDSSAEQGYYHVVNDAVVNVTIATASAVNPRIDAIVLAVNDSTEIGGADEYKLEAIAGTPTASASLANLSGAPTPGPTKLLLAYVLVGKEVASITNEKIGGKVDYRAGLTGYPAVTEPKSRAGAPAQYAHGRPLSYVPACEGIRSATQAINNATVTALQLTAADAYDLEEIHNPASESEKLICRTPGFYLVSTTLNYSVGTSIHAHFRINGGANLAQVQSTDNAVSTSAFVRLGYGDAVEATGWQTSGGALTFSGLLKMLWQGP